MPEWMLPTLREFPVTLLIAGFIWVVVKYLDRRAAENFAREVRTRELQREESRERVELVLNQQAAEREQIAAERKLLAAERERVDQSHAAHLRSKDAEIRRLTRRRGRRRE